MVGLKRLIAALEAGRRDFLDAVRGVPPDLLPLPPPDGRWSVVTCIEHVVAFEYRYSCWIRDGEFVEVRRDAEKELRLFSMMRSRLTRLETADLLRPRQIRERGDCLYSVGVKHPYLGMVNGAEIVAMIDAHARRHADQIPEMGVAVAKTTKKQATGTKDGTGFKRDEPDLPFEFDAPGDAASALQDGEFVSLEGMRLQHVERVDARMGTLHVDGSELDGVRLAGGQFGSAVWKDVRLSRCDLANVRARRMDLLRVAFVDCRMTGLTTDAVDWKDVLVRNGDLSYAQVAGGTFQSCEFEGCKWQEADLQNTDFSGCVFRSCDFSRADLRGARLNGADFRTSEIEGMVVGIHDLRGAIVSADQAIVLSRVLGIVIK